MEWYLKKEDGEVYGPVALQNLVQWSTEGRLAPGDEISLDRDDWKSVTDQPELAMDWIVRLASGEQYGPLHMMALAHLVDDGSIEAQAKVEHKTSGESYVLSEALLGLLMDRNASLQVSFDAINMQMLELEAELQSFRAKPAPDTPESGAGGELRRQLKELASRSDMLQKESTKWRRLYDEERATSTRKTEQLNQRIEELRISDAQARSRLEETSRRLRQVEKAQAALMQAAEAAAGTEGAQALAAQFAELMNAYNQLSRNYDKLFEQVSEKSNEIGTLMESRRETEEHAEQRLHDMEHRVRREIEEADKARKGLLDMEETHHLLLKSYRDLNSRFIQLRQQMAAPTAAAVRETAASGEPESQTESGGPRIRLSR